MSIADKLIEIAGNVPRVFAAGKTAEAARCAAKHYTEVKKGDGTNKFSVDCGFEPDLFMVFSTAGYPMTVANVINMLYQDFRGMGKHSAYRRNTDANGDQSNATIKTSAAVRFFPREGGVVSYDGSQSTSAVSQGYIFDANTYYTAVCVKYTDKTDAEIITDLVNALPDSGGSVEFAEIKVNGAFSEEEWQTLIATKPNWTFVMV